ncbi:DNA cytosine methyltransferase, partial [Brucella melitensis]
KDGVQCLVLQEGKNPRRLSPRECFRLQGFPDSFIIPESKIQAYKQAGNSVSIPVIEAIAKQIKKALAQAKEE